MSCGDIFTLIYRSVTRVYCGSKTNKYLCSCDMMLQNSLLVHMWPLCYSLCLAKTLQFNN